MPPEPLPKRRNMSGPAIAARRSRFCLYISKRILCLGRLRLRCPSGACDEFLLAVTAQNADDWQSSDHRPGR
jgi:hypothetical protein